MTIENEEHLGRSGGCEGIKSDRRGSEPDETCLKVTGRKGADLVSGCLAAVPALSTALSAPSGFPLPSMVSALGRFSAPFGCSPPFCWPQSSHCLFLLRPINSPFCRLPLILLSLADRSATFGSTMNGWRRRMTGNSSASGPPPGAFCGAPQPPGPPRVPDVYSKQRCTFAKDGTCFWSSGLNVGKVRYSCSGGFFQFFLI